MQIKNNQQGSEAWLEDRKGKMTASHAQAIASNGKGLETYVYELLADKYSKESENYSSPDMDRGNDLENVARTLYELQTGEYIEQVGFVELDEYSGASPDGLIGEEGGIEIKCQNDKNHFHTLMTGKIETKYEWQIQMNLYVTGRKWWDYVGFNPNFEKDLYIKRIYPDEEMIEKLKKGLETGKKLIKQLEEQYGKNLS